MKYWERELRQLISSFEAQFGCRPTAILAWNDAYSWIRSDWQNVVVQRFSGKIIWRGYDVIRVDAPGDRIVLDGGVLDRHWEE